MPGVEDEQKKEWWRQRRWWAAGAGLLITLILIDVVVAFTVPPRVASHIGTASVADRLKAESDLRSAILSLLGALTPLVALIAGVVALLNFQETRRQNVASLEVTRRGQVTDRFTKAIEQLGEPDDKKLDMRLGGIYGLEQIAKDSKDLHWPIMQILTAYLREHSVDVLKGLAQQVETLEALEQGHYMPDGVDPGEYGDHLRKAIEVPARADFLALADVIRRRRSDWDPIAQIDDKGQEWREPVNLERCDLRHADLRRAQLEGANLRSAQLTRSRFGGARLERANFWSAQLKGANFEDAQLKGAYFVWAQLEGANFGGARLEEAYFGEAELEGANFGGAELEGAYFGGARLERANFEGTDLTLTRGLTPPQLDSAICNESTQRPPALAIKRTDTDETNAPSL